MMAAARSIVLSGHTSLASPHALAALAEILGPIERPRPERVPGPRQDSLVMSGPRKYTQRRRRPPAASRPPRPMTATAPGAGTTWALKR